METAKKEEEKVVKPKKTNKVKTPKVKLISYTVKAIIPTGAYANIQPEVVVQAETLEQAERAVMPHIEALFAKYREGVPMVKTEVVTPATGPQENYRYDGKGKESELVKTTPSQTAVAPAVAMSEPFNRAKRAIETATSLNALNMINDQISKSVKLIDSEKVELLKLVATKILEVNANQTNKGTA